MRILLINPPQINPLKIGIEDDFIDIIGYYPPLGLLYLASVLKNSGFDVEVIDCPPLKMSFDDLDLKITQFMPDLVGITTYTTEMFDVLTTANLVKQINPKIITILGGHHPLLYPHESIRYNNVDYILRGEAEETIIELVTAIETNQTFDKITEIKGIGFYRDQKEYLNLELPIIKNLDSLPIPDRSFLPMDVYKSIVGRNSMVATVMSSRGCPFLCTYCFSPSKMYRTRQTENIIAEIEYLVSLGFKEIFFFDDLFALKPEKVIEFSKMLRERKIKIDWSFRARIPTITEDLVKEIKLSGVHRIQFGIESGLDKTLKRMKKGTTTDQIKNAIKLCSKHNITTIGSFIIGFPDESKEDILQTIRFSKTIGLNYAQYNILMPYPFTAVYQEGLQQKIFSKDYWHNFAENPLDNQENFKMEYWTKEVSEDYLFFIVKKAFKQFYFRPVTIWNKIKEIKTWQELKYAIVGAFSVLKFNPKKQSDGKH